MRHRYPQITVENRRTGFTLVELLVVIAIIGVLVALLLPAVQAAREAARRMQCVNNLKQIGLGIHNFETARKEAPGGSAYPNHFASLGYWQNGEQVEWNWITAIMPYMEQQALKDSFHMDFGSSAGTWPGDGALTTAGTNSAISAKAELPMMLCPSDPFAMTIFKQSQGSQQPTGEIWTYGNENPLVAQGNSYLGSLGPTAQDICLYDNAPDVCMGGSWGSQDWAYGASPCFKDNDSCVQNGMCVGMICRHPEGIKFRSVTDGLSNTYMVGETLADDSNRNCIVCTNCPLGTTQLPLNYPYTWKDNYKAYYAFNGFRSAHPSGANMLLADGSVQFVQDHIDYRLWNYFGTTAGGDGQWSKKLSGTSGGGGGR